jgi:hypothetical protein
MPRTTTERALTHVPRQLYGMFRERVAAADFYGALALVSSEYRIPTLRALWRHVPASRRAQVLGDAISTGDFLAPYLGFLTRALRSIRGNGERAFDGEGARQEFSGLPDRITAYRGTVQAEVDDVRAGRTLYGVCWTFDRGRAVFFATEHGRFRNTQSTPVLLTVAVRRDDIAGYLVERQEAELLLEPRFTLGATSEALVSDEK